MKNAKPTPEQLELARDFYRPHARVYQPVDLVDHRTGELKTPQRRVKQSFVAECDINNILKQYSVTGQLKHINAKAQQGQYLDLPDEVDYQASLQIIKDGETAFASLPAKTRDRFENDPAAFLEFMADPKNQDEAIKLGLATKRPAEAQNEPQAPSKVPDAPTAPDGSKQAPTA